MAKKTSQFVCQNCGTVYPRWAGKCDSCGEWNTIVEENLPQADSPTSTGGKGGRKIEFADFRGAPENGFRVKSNISELERVRGGGHGPGSGFFGGGGAWRGMSTLLF